MCIATIQALESRLMLYAGQLDPSFDEDGISQTFNAGNAGYLEMDDQGRFYFSHNAGSGFTRFRADGTLDTSFGVGGLVSLGYYSYSHQFRRLASGKFLTAGIFISSPVQTRYARVVRFNADGSVDTSFAGDGTWDGPVGATDPSSIDIAEQSDGRAIVTLGSAAGASITRLNLDGSTDASFGTAGWVGPSTALGQYPMELLVDSSDRILVEVSNKIIRLSHDGYLDTTFGVDGSWAAIPTGIVGANLQPDGKILFMGYTYRNENDLNYYIGRLDANGRVDPTFTPFVGPSYGPMLEASNPVMQPDGRIVLSGTGAEVVHLWRLLPDGTLDTSFGQGAGRIDLPVATGNRVSLRMTRPVIQPDGKIVAAYCSYASNTKLIRVLNDLVPANVTSWSFAHAAPHPTLKFTFDQYLTQIDPSWLQVSNLTTPQQSPATSVLWNALTRTAEFQFPSTLADGNYRATLTQPIPSGSAAPITYDFFVLAADANRDRAVNFFDLTTLSANYGQSNKGWADGDFNGDGTVNFFDLTALAANYSATLPAPGDVPADALPTAPAVVVGETESGSAVEAGAAVEPLRTSGAVMVEAADPGREVSQSETGGLVASAAASVSSGRVIGGAARVGVVGGPPRPGGVDGLAGGGVRVSMPPLAAVFLKTPRRRLSAGAVFALSPRIDGLFG